MIWPSAPIKTELLKPKFSMLLAILRIFFLACRDCACDPPRAAGSLPALIPPTFDTVRSSQLGFRNICILHGIGEPDKFPIGG